MDGPISPPPVLGSAGNELPGLPVLARRIFGTADGRGNTVCMKEGPHLFHPSLWAKAHGGLTLTPSLPGFSISGAARAPRWPGARSAQEAERRGAHCSNTLRSVAHFEPQMPEPSAVDAIRNAATDEAGGSRDKDIHGVISPALDGRLRADSVFLTDAAPAVDATGTTASESFH